MSARSPRVPPESASSSARGLLARHEQRTLLRFATIGSVDSGKSSLIGRLLHDTGNIHTDHLSALVRDTRVDVGSEPFDFSLLTDGLKAEREQGITIDVAYRYFATERRSFIIADIPGHEQYTRNMATGASTAHLAILLVDARDGVLTQTRRHAFIASLLGIPRILLAVNKMDLVGHAPGPFERVQEEFGEFAMRLGIADLKFIPISAFRGDNVVRPSERMPWYEGGTVLDHLQGVYVGSDRNLVDFRMPIQCVLRGEATREIAGRIASGRVRVGDDVMVLPSMRRSRVRAIRTPRGEEESAVASQSVSIGLEDHVDVTRGDMLVRPNNLPHIDDHFEAMVVWMNDAPSRTGRRYLLRVGPREVPAEIQEVTYRVDVDTLSRDRANELGLNEIGRVALRSAQPICLDPYQRNRATGRFVLIDVDTNDTVAAGMVIDRRSGEQLRELDRAERANRAGGPAGEVTSEERRARSGHRALTLWLTGLSGAGKSTIAAALERALFDRSCAVVRLDGDTLRAGLNRGLGFSREDRSENIRRVAEVAKLLNDAGMIVIASLISPYEADRERARAIVGEGEFLEVFVTAPLEICEERDPKGLYRRARGGEVPNFTGISDPYETPQRPKLTLDTAALTVDECVGRLVDLLSGEGALRR